MAPSRTVRSFSLPPPSLISLTIASVQRQRSSQYLTPYDPDVVFKDKHSAFDPQPVSCQFYAEQVKHQFSDRKLLATFDTVAQEYVHWNV